MTQQTVPHSVPVHIVSPFGEDRLKMMLMPPDFLTGGIWMRSFKGGWWEIVAFPKVLALPKIENDLTNESGEGSHQPSLQPLCTHDPVLNRYRVTESDLHAHRVPSPPRCEISFRGART